ncbi:MAG TPA: preprotein translocase subunit SecY [candidate division Zixibacteria bacterium]|nr:preprotein translocase subunit SecY [candidate division Zixibacteria bacterium]MDD4918445.1 preprotein translocase subunit SecY [candidate division Zixibacteria bacterium]MDM7971772.1 preprotein translocase subunit SecY [candidate division Zixibacteria bacterium]HOD67542.1 preprotein translocase subunit SecY [candidate division Zixibacteria bacterium]HPI32716.1 preprotein translocase subunit SecY [candidate division Zixibacteria bacterium]
MIDKFRSVFKVEELRRRIFYTLALLVVYRIGGHIPTPGIDGSILASVLANNTIFGLFDLFVGGAFAKATIFAMGIMPYISASIMLQLLGAVVPYLQRLQREGEEGRRKITQYTRYLTVLIAALQAWGTAGYLTTIKSAAGVSAVHMNTAAFIPLTILTFTSGTIFIMWLGEQITERGIGNGISLIIFIGIIARFPEAVVQEVLLVWHGSRNLFVGAIMLAAMVAVIAAVILVTRAQRRVPVQYPRKVVGRRVFGGATTHLPLSVNSAGVIPIIFAQSIMFLPSTVAQLFPNTDWVQNLVAVWLAPGGLWYSLIYGVIIIFFAYFYTAIVFNPMEIADNMRKNGGYIPGIRPGKNTADYIEKILTRITLPGAIFFAAIAILPWVLIGQFNVNFFFGGTGLLIVVGVALDTLQQIESHLIMRHYDGFMKKGRIRGRSM